jgi:hypothetical protein
MKELTNAEIREVVNRYIQNLFDRFANVRVRPMSAESRGQMSIGMKLFADGIPDMFREESLLGITPMSKGVWIERLRMLGLISIGTASHIKSFVGR